VQHDAIMRVHVRYRCWCRQRRCVERRKEKGRHGFVPRRSEQSTTGRAVSRADTNESLSQHKLRLCLRTSFWVKRFWHFATIGAALSPVSLCIVLAAVAKTRSSLLAVLITRAPVIAPSTARRHHGAYSESQACAGDHVPKPMHVEMRSG
jgi:hypothetical protein